MNSRRLDYDYKISQHEKGKCTDDELYTAEDKFNESMQNSDVGMKKFVQAQVALSLDEWITLQPEFLVLLKAPSLTLSLF